MLTKHKMFMRATPSPHASYVDRYMYFYKETVELIEDRKVAEEYSEQFKQLYREINKN